MRKFAFSLVGLLVFYILGFWTATQSITQHKVPSNISASDRKTYQISELRLVRRAKDGNEVSVRGFIYKGDHSGVWLTPTASGYFEKSKSMYLPDFPFGLEDNSGSREVTLVGRYGCLDESLGFDALAPLKSILIIP